MHRKPYHPPVASPYIPPESDAPGYILGAHGGVVGFGKRGFYVAAIPAQKARETILRHHYSQTIVCNSYIHLGVYIKVTSRASCNLGMPSSPLVPAGLSRGRYRANIWNLTACGLQKYARETLKAWRSAMRSSMSVAQARASHGCSLLPTNDAGGLALSIRRQTSSILAVMQQLSTFWTEITTIGYF